ncbi:DUF1746-domain-containing protein [Eremomyces bilateralis CBS 781.70]|uniref:DUF1746-domain-containing protein n=1 Tax=Eremomyces bilateralis CBS 781.70 TaxID=1392243 RepID=A0A6G1GGL2_9PEZI|nr:DUF1746-domain-containing protein [Eremomyces bilateralis CBS 781.70]KAF1817009.1 DUF1746-domain-containing protein [Eremomyces bilateralis CBS 781.70]
MSNERTAPPSHAIPRDGPHASSPAAPSRSIVAGNNQSHGAARARAKAEAKRLEQLEHLVRSYDLLIYSELAVVYCMDNSFFALFFRALAQLLYLSPKPPFLSENLPAATSLTRTTSSVTPGGSTPSSASTPANPFVTPHQSSPTISAIFITNILCMVLHLYCARPSASEAARGYLHGGLLIDFIGQEGPISKLSLLMLDFAIMGLQVIMLSVNGEVRRVTMERKGTVSTGAATQVSTQGNTAQDHDAEERGEILGASSSTAATPSAAAISTPSTTSEQSNTLDDPSAADMDILDGIVSTQTPLATFRFLYAAREEYNAYQGPSTGISRRPAAASFLQGLAERRRMVLVQRGAARSLTV